MKKCRFACIIMIMLIISNLFVLSVFAETDLYTANLSIEVKNELSGSVRNNEDSDFKFTISPYDNAPMPVADNIVISGTGKSYFYDIKFSKPGIYEYLVSPIEGNNNHITYDMTKYKVSVVVKNINQNPDEGLEAFVAAIENLDDGKKIDEGLIFSSTCSYTPISNPQTGDIYNYNFWIFLIVMSVFSAIVVILIDNKRSFVTDKHKRK